MQCPDCEGELVAKRADPIELDECRDCGGAWFDRDELAIWAAAHAASPDAAYERFIRHPGGLRWRCPRCGTESVEFGEIAGVGAASCPGCRGAFLTRDQMRRLRGLPQGGDETAVEIEIVDWILRRRRIVDWNWLWPITLLVSLVAGWTILDGLHALVTGDFVTPQAGDHAGQLGPWADLLERLRIPPRSPAVAVGFVAYGALYAFFLGSFVRRRPVGWPGLVACAAVGLLYLVLGTALNALILGMLFLPSVRAGRSDDARYLRTGGGRRTLRAARSPAGAGDGK